jgi:hypothetical protein
MRAIITHNQAKIFFWVSIVGFVLTFCIAVGHLVACGLSSDYPNNREAMTSSANFWFWASLLPLTHLYAVGAIDLKRMLLRNFSNWEQAEKIAFF